MDAFSILQKRHGFVSLKLSKVIQNEKSVSIASIRRGHRGEFKNTKFENNCNDNEIEHIFFSPRIP